MPAPWICAACQAVNSYRNGSCYNCEGTIAK